jgi:S-formylglutathione hydrolase FrmB
VVYDQLPAPWVGGHTVNVSVYLPAGYGTGGRRYPVVYETVFSFATMDKAFNAKSEIDALIDDGQVPASIVVLIDTSGGPYLDSECANSTDGQEWMGTFIGETVPTYIDSHYLTIARRAARTVLGFSQGGYCAAILTLDYPNVFGNAVSFSGYFHAGLGSANAWRPFGHSQKILDQFSPTLVAPQLSAGTLAGLYFVLDYDPALLGDAREADGFVAVLRRSGYRYTVIASRQKHSWAQVREGLGPALALVGGRQAEEHIFS